MPADRERLLSAEELTCAVCITVDVEWAAAEVLADLTRMLDERGVAATFFCTHQGVEVPGHERGLHPNFRRGGDTVRRLKRSWGAAFEEWHDDEFYRRVVAATRQFCPEAVGIRCHSLFHDVELFGLYQDAGLTYDSTYFLPLMPHIRPVKRTGGVLEMPIYYMDHFDMIQHHSGFRADKLALRQPGLKVFDFHPNMVYLNACDDRQYQDCRPFYHDPVRLRRRRGAGRGVRTLFADLLDAVDREGLPTATLAQVDRSWRAAMPAGEGE